MYTKSLEPEDVIYTIKEFKEHVINGFFIDYDGFGYPIKNNKADPKIIIKPSKMKEIPKDATHIIWFNK